LPRVSDFSLNLSKSAVSLYKDAFLRVLGARLAKYLFKRKMFGTNITERSAAGSLRPVVQFFRKSEIFYIIERN
jgi:hypothetical protein